MHSMHSQSASPSGSQMCAKDSLKRNQLPQPLLAFLFAAGFLLGIRRSRLAVCYGRLRCRILFLYFIYLGWCWFWGLSFGRSGILRARWFFVGAQRSRSCTHGLHTDVLAW